MSARKSKISEDQKRNQEIKSDIFLGFVGLVFMLLQYYLFKRTLINPFILITFIFVIGIIAMLLDYKRYIFVYEYHGIVARIVCFLQNTLIWGGIIGLLFLAINYFLADGQSIRNNYKIIESNHEITGKRNQSAYSFTVMIEDSYKKTFYVSADEERLSEYNKLKLTTNKGFLGFDIVRFSSLKR